MKFLITSIGTRGDIQPYIALSVGLQNRGYQVVLMSHPCFSELVSAYGIPFVPMGPDIDLGEVAAEIRGRSRNWMAGMMRTMRFSADIHRQSFPQIYEQCKNVDAVIVSHSGTGSIAADKLGRPKISVTFIPQAIPSNDPATTWLMKNIGKIAGFGMQMIMARPINNIRRQYDLPKMGPEGITSKLLNLIPLSPIVFPPNDYWDSRHKMTGYWFLDEADNWTPSTDLENFLAVGDPPVVFSLGAMSTGQDSIKMADIVIKALKKTKQRAIVQGWQEASALLNKHDHIFHAGAVPHSWLFKHVAAVIHHGGFGTTSAVLRAGLPSLIIPHILDQYIWGNRIYEMGIGPKPISRKELNEDNLGNALNALLNNPTMRSTADNIGVKIRLETGIENAVNLIEKKLNTRATLL